MAKVVIGEWRAIEVQVLSAKVCQMLNLFLNKIRLLKSFKKFRYVSLFQLHIYG